MLTTFTVTNLLDSGDGSLRHQVDAANNAVGADVIEFEEGLEGTIGLTSGEFALTDDVTIDGPGQERLIISGNGLSRVFNVINVEGASDVMDVEISHLTIADGHIDGLFGLGGGILNTGGNLSLNHVAMKNNQAIDTPYGGGGAIFNIDGATLLVTNSLFESNRATNTTDAAFPVSGGAIANVSGSRTVITDSRFINNEVDGGESTGLGGAVSNVFSASLEVNDSQFHGNSVSGTEIQGGAIYNGFGGNSAVVTNSEFDGNSVNGRDLARGGAIANEGRSTLTVYGSSILNNLAIGSRALGAGIYNAPMATSRLSSFNADTNQTVVDGVEDSGDGIQCDAVFARVESSDVHCVAAQPGDANRDGQFDRLDILQVLQAGKFQTDQAAVWGQGDWNLDGVFNQDDIVAALQIANYSA